MAGPAITFDLATHVVTLPPGWSLYPWGQLIIDEPNRRAFAPAPWAVAVPPPPPSPVAAINAARLANGAAALAFSSTVQRTAMGWAEMMASLGVLTHGNFSGRLWAVLPGAAIGEDIASGQVTAEAAVSAWMGDPAHRSILLGDWTSAGMGSATDARGTRYWCADFARVPPGAAS